MENEAALYLAVPLKLFLAVMILPCVLLSESVMLPQVVVGMLDTIEPEAVFLPITAMVLLLVQEPVPQEHFDLGGQSSYLR
jgi:hypothetical protein